MSLRCKVGDMAIIIKSDAGNAGRIVTCKKFIGSRYGYGFDCDDLWEIDTKINTLVIYTFNGSTESRIIKDDMSYSRDAYMMPLPKLDEEIETEIKNVETA